MQRLKLKVYASAAKTHSTYLQRSQVFDIWEVMSSSHLEAPYIQPFARGNFPFMIGNLLPVLFVSAQLL